MQKLGIVNLTLLTAALGGGATVVGLIMEDGAVNFRDLQHLKAAFTVLNTAKSVSWKDLLPEAKDIDEAERESLAKLFADTFVLPEVLKSTEEVVEAGLGYLLLALDAISAFLPDAAGVVKVPLKSFKAA